MEDNIKNEIIDANIFASYKNFKLLISLRNIAIVLYLCAILYGYFFANILLPLPLLLFDIGALAVANITALWLFGKAEQFSNVQIFGWIIFDTLFLSLILIQTGGSSNPFLSIIIVPLMLGSLMLPSQFAWGVFIIGVLCLAFIELLESPIIIGHSRHTSFFDPHSQGMMLAFAISSALLVYFVNQVSQNLKERDIAVNDLKRQNLEEAQIVRLGLLSAGAAHELSSPLSTVSVILNDWKSLNPPEEKAERDDELNMMISQIDACKNILSRILANSGNTRASEIKLQLFSEFLQDMLDEWAENLAYDIDIIDEIELPDFFGVCDMVLQQSIISVLDNAKRANIQNNQKDILFKAFLEDGNIIISIEDNGKGFPPNILEKIGKPQKSIENNGHGVGLFLAKGTLRTIGGNLIADNKPNHKGAIVKIIIPRAAIEIIKK